MTGRLRHGRKHCVVLIRAGEHRNISVIFCGGADHRRASDINVFDRLIPGDIRFGHRFPERIEIHHHQIDGRDVLLLKISLMEASPRLARMPPCTWVQRLHPSAKDLRCAGVLGHAGHRKTSFLQDFGGATAGEKCITMGAMQRLRQRHNAVFVGHAQQRKRSHGFQDDWVLSQPTQQGYKGMDEQPPGVASRLGCHGR